MTNKAEQFTDLPIEFYNEVNDDETLYDEIDRRLRTLARDNTDIVGASANLRDANLGTESGYEATIVAYTRPSHTVGTVVAKQPLAAIKGALDAVERQVREKREKLRGY